MPFIPDSSWGIAYAMALIIASAVAWRGPNISIRIAVILMVIHWLSMRSIDAVDFSNFWLWTGQGALMILALVFIGKSIPAYAMACVFFVGMLFDQYTLFTGGSFDGAAAVAEAVGYISMIIMATGAHNGRVLHIGRSHGVRPSDPAYHMEAGCAISSCSRMPSNGSSNNSHVAAPNGLN